MFESVFFGILGVMLVGIAAILFVIWRQFAHYHRGRSEFRGDGDDARLHALIRASGVDEDGSVGSHQISVCPPREPARSGACIGSGQVG